MAKRRKTNITRDFLGNGRRVQQVLNAPQYIKEFYISPKGLRLLKEFGYDGTGDSMFEKNIRMRYGKNRLRPNPECTHVVKTIIHN